MTNSIIEIVKIIINIFMYMTNDKDVNKKY